MNGLDTSRPNAARVYDYLLGGKDNFAADRALADALEAADPPRDRAPGVLPSSGARRRAQENRQFILAAVRRAAAEGGIRQFLDLGAGLPARPAVHDVARDVTPGARVAYVDRDPVAHAHAAALLAGGPGVAASGADPEKPGEVLADPAVLSVTDPAEPVAIVIGSVLHFLGDDDARKVCAGYIAAMAPGSWLITTSAWFEDPELLARLRELYTPAEVHPHPPDVFRSFFGGLRIVPPGITTARLWAAGLAEKPCREAGHVLAAAGIKP